MIVATRLVAPSHSEETVGDQVKCLYTCMRDAGVLHRDLGCKNTEFVNGTIILLDWDAAWTERYNESIKTPLYRSKLAAWHVARTFPEFWRALGRCYEDRWKAYQTRYNEVSRDTADALIRDLRLENAQLRAELEAARMTGAEGRRRA